LGIHHRQLPLLPGPVPLSAGGKSASRLTGRVAAFSWTTEVAAVA
jgi:hypothetical protein